MNSKQTDSSQEKKQIPGDWTPAPALGKSKSVKPTNEEVEAEFRKMLENGVIDGISPSRNVTKKHGNSIATDETIQAENSNNTADSLQTELQKPVESTIPIVPKRTSSKQRKESLEEYRQTFLQVAKLEDRKPVFVSREIRDRIDEIVHRLGGRGRSVSGFIENLARHHLEIYEEDIEVWKKL